eukprot:Opistho-2@40547
MESFDSAQPRIRRRLQFNNRDETAASARALFQSKPVLQLQCGFCESQLCLRGMRAILLADVSVELFSTDMPPVRRVDLVGDDFMTKNCLCKIRNFCCLTCGNTMGYHVTKPCMMCLAGCNNGHFWMFHSDAVRASERFDPRTGTVMFWSQVPCANDDSVGLVVADDTMAKDECCR